MVMSMDTYAEQTMSSPPLPSNEDSASPSAIMSSSSSSPFQQQESADDEHEDEHSKGSNQTVVPRHQEQHSAQLRGDSDSTTPIVDERVGSAGTNDHHEKMIVSRGSSFDGDKKSEMHVDDESNEESSMRTNLKFDTPELKARLAQQAKTSATVPAGSKVESSLVAQMRDIVEGGLSRVASGEKQHNDEQGQPKSSSDSLNNQNDNNTSKASLDSATGHKRTRHSRVHQCRHHYSHHQHHSRHRQSISGTSITGAQLDSNLAPSGNTAIIPAHPHPHYQHHHRHSNTGHTHPHPHHHHHHHSGHHHHHHHHHHHQDKNKGTSSKRNSIQRLPLNESIASQQQSGKNESNSSVSSVSLTKRGQQSNNPNQSQPESGKSSESPSDEQAIVDPENQEPSQHQQASRDGHHHHHHNHHHHCHHRSHKKRLVLDASNNQAEAVAKSEDLSSRKKALQDSTSGMNVEAAKYQHHHAHSQPHEHGHHHHHHHHHHHAHHHNHPHPHHHHHHAQSIHCADDQGNSNKDLTDPSQQQAISDSSHHHHQRHHKHHHNHHHHGHHCRHTRHRNRGRSGSKANSSLRDSGKNLDTVGAEQVTERRFSSHSVAGVKRRDNDDHQSTRDENESLVASKNDDVVNMDVSPKSDKKISEVILNDQRAAAISDVNREPVEGPSTSIEGDASQIGPSDGGGGTGGNTSRKHDSSCNFDQTIQADQENMNSRGGGVGGNDEEGHNRLSRQISSQSSKKSQKESLRGVSQNQQDQRHNDCNELGPQVANANEQSSGPRQVIESGVTADRRCRLCWCCCCPCSALNVREAPDRSVDKNKSTLGPPSSPTQSKYLTPPNVSLDEIRSWGDSFDKLMKCTDGRKVFQDFLRCEYSEENILFWSACEDLKKERDSKSIAAKARDIYEDYISILSSKEVSLDSRVRDVINNNIKKPTSNIFDEAQLQIYTLMHRDSYPRFINSGMYKKLAQITTSNSRKSSS